MIANRMFSKIVVAAAVALTAATGAMAADKSKWPKSMTLGTASVGGTYFIYGGVVASLLTEKLGIQVSTQQTQGYEWQDHWRWPEGWHLRHLFPDDV
ncbi:MAG: hypothetical protein ACO3V3_08845 [Burkholderiaceae bacterium]